MAHQRLGHPSYSTLKAVVSCFSLPCFTNSSTSSPCNDCLLNKTQKLPFYQSTIVSTHPLEYLFTDVWQSPILSTQNYRYYLVLVDHFTRYTWLFPLTKKSDVKDIFQTFTPIAETKFKTKICNLYSDNGGEFRGIGFHQNLSWIMVELCGLFRIAPSQLTLRSWGLIHALQVLSDLSAVEITGSMVATAFCTQEIGEGSRRFEFLPLPLCRSLVELPKWIENTPTCGKKISVLDLHPRPNGLRLS